MEQWSSHNTPSCACRFSDAERQQVHRPACLVWYPEEPVQGSHNTSPPLVPARSADQICFPCRSVGIHQGSRSPIELSVSLSSVLLRGQFCLCTTTAHAFRGIPDAFTRCQLFLRAVYLVVRLPGRPHSRYLFFLLIHTQSVETPLRKPRPPTTTIRAKPVIRIEPA